MNCNIAPSSYPLPSLHNPKLVIAFIGAIGTELQLAENLLIGILKQYHYMGETIKITDYFKDFDPSYNENGLDLYQRYQKSMDFGDQIRRALKTNDALAQKAISLIAHKPSSGDERKAYIIHSIKKPEEIEAFRSVYNELFYCIAVHAHAEKRLKRLIDKARNKARRNNLELSSIKAKEKMETLLKRDENDDENITEDGQKYGQDVRHAFEKADYYIGTDENGKLAEELERFVGLIFDSHIISPTIQETAMVHAYMSGLRSTDLSRQVGAAIVGRDGEILTTGCNEVPRPGGGQYRHGDINDARDIKNGYDSNDRLKLKTMMEMIRAISHVDLPESRESEKGISQEALSKPLTCHFPLPEIESSSEDSEEYYHKCYEFYKTHLETHLKGTRIDSILEFSRVVHAEMAAIDEAAMKNISIRDGDLYCMTFPCHLCARLIINSGIRNVFYIEPYPKSLTQELFEKESEVNYDMSNGYLEKRLGSNSPFPPKVAFIPFTGVAPRRYGALFAANKRRKLKNGDLEPINRTGDPRRAPIMTFYENAENTIKDTIEEAQKNFLSLSNFLPVNLSLSSGTVSPNDKDSRSQ